MKFSGASGPPGLSTASIIKRPMTTKAAHAHSPLLIDAPLVIAIAGMVGVRSRYSELTEHAAPVTRDSIIPIRVGVRLRIGARRRHLSSFLVVP
jgi:hypothetical protein